MHVPLDLACGGGEEEVGGSLLQVVPVSDRRRCRVSRNRSPPMSRGGQNGRTVAVVYYRYYIYDCDYYFEHNQYIALLVPSFLAWRSNTLTRDS